MDNENLVSRIKSFGAFIPEKFDSLYEGLSNQRYREFQKRGFEIANQSHFDMSIAIAGFYIAMPGGIGKEA